MQKFLRWLDDYSLPVAAGFLLLFIPLYPKLPLFDVLPGYIVRVRLEDFIVAGTIFLWGIQVLRRKVHITDNPLLKLVLAYGAVGILSILSAIFIIQTIPQELVHIQKSVLHFLRRIEYISLFFIFYSATKTLKTLRVYIGILFITAISVALYGFGQKYLYWPAFSTMNREFAKGWMLYLTEHARVLSTFGGHYDLAAFTMMMLVVFWSLFFGTRKILARIGIFLVIAASFWLLILTASRTSFLAYLAGVTGMFFLWSFKRGIAWSVPRWAGVIILSVVFMLSFGDLSERFTKLLRLDERFGGIKSVLFSPFGKPPEDKALFLENNPDQIAQITSKTDQPPTPIRPDDVFQDDPLLIPDSTNSASVTAVARTYSRTAFQYDLSTAIRFDALWPMAIKGFKKNPLLGSGYATLNKTNPTQFTEAESTDNDYLRNLGETGILGFSLFFGMLIFVGYRIWRNIPVMGDTLLFSFTIGVAGTILGLLVNAVYIDVFESSKVAFSFWAIAGTTLAAVRITKGRKTVPYPSIPDWNRFWKKASGTTVRFLKSDVFILLLLLSLSFWVRLYQIKTPLADWHSWRQADTSAVTRNYVRHGINILFPTYDDLSNIASGKDNPRGLRMVEFPLYNIASVITDKLFVGYTVEISGRLTSIFASLGTLIFLFLLMRKYVGRLEAVLAGLFFAIIPYGIFYSRVILPEPMLVFLSTGMLYFVDKWIEKAVSFRLSANGIRKQIKFYLAFFLALFFTAAALLVKPYAAFLFLPLAYLWMRGLGFSFTSFISLLFFLGIASLPFVWWRWWIAHFPEGVPANTWLLNGDNIRFKGAFFYWLFADRMGRLILGYWGIFPFVLGLLVKGKKHSAFFIWWFLGILAYLTVFATGNVRHDYYQALVIPIAVVFLAKGVGYLLRVGIAHSRAGSILLAGITVVFMEMFGWYHIRDYFNINHPEIVDAGRVLELKTPDKSLVIAPYDGDTAFLYQTHRSGWPIMEHGIEDMIKMGADYYVSVRFDDLTKKLIREAQITDPDKKKYTLIDFTSSYVVIQLVPNSKLPK